MKTRTVILGIGVALVLVALVVVLTTRRDAALLVVNGTFHTVNGAKPVAQAIAIRDGRILAVGTTEEITRAYRAPAIIDLHGAPAYPGFIDSHAHLEGLGAALMTLDLSGATSVQDVQAMVAREAAGKKEGTWIRGRGWDQTRWPGKAFPTSRDLDMAARSIPVCLRRVDGHAAWVNSTVMAMAHITGMTADPAGGRIIRDRNGNPTGVLIDNAVGLLDSVLPPPTRAERVEAISRAMRRCLSVGLTEVHDMGVDREEVEIYREMIQDVPFRVYAVIGGTGDAWDYYQKKGPEIGGEEGKLTVRALKLYADGALGSRGAALVEPYSDEPGNRGLTLTSSQDLMSAARECAEKGFQLCVHAIGDRANNLVLSTYEEAFKVLKVNGLDVRFRVEHAQVLMPADIGKFARLGVLPMMQPTHCTSDMYWAEDRLGPKRVQGAYAWRSLLDSGSIVPCGSDFPVEDPNPLYGIYAAVTRQDRQGWPEGGWYPGQRMTREEALKAFTIWGAYAGFQERDLGTIEPGKWADVTVLTKDIMTIAPDEIPSTTVAMTLVAGVVAYEKKAAD